MELHLSAHDRARIRERKMEHNIDYLIMHFIISVTIECLPSLVAHSCSCSSAALMRKIKNNHKRVIFTYTDHQIASCCSRRTHTHTFPPNLARIATVLSYLNQLHEEKRILAIYFVLFLSVVKARVC